jgi:hypothetical protein
MRSGLPLSQLTLTRVKKMLLTPKINFDLKIYQVRLTTLGLALPQNSKLKAISFAGRWTRNSDP